MSKIDNLTMKQLRLKLGYTMQSFADFVGVSKMTILRIENNQTPVSNKIEQKIKEKIGSGISDWLDYKLHVHLDYLRLSFFDSTIEKVITHGLGLEKRFFRVEENHAKSYTHIYSCGAIKIYVGLAYQDKDGKHHDPREDILLEMSGMALKEYEEILQKRGFSLLEWLQTIQNEDWARNVGLYSKLQSSRIDIAIDELYRLDGSNYDIHELLKKRDDNLLETSLKTARNIEEHFEGKTQGLTLYFGSKHGHFLVRIYEKAKEIMKKQQKDFDTVIQENGVINRYEMQCSGNYAEHILLRLYHGVSLEKIALNLFLSKFEVYEKTEDGKFVFDKKFYAIFGDYTKIKVNNKKEIKTLEKKLIWLNTQVMPTLATIREIKGNEWLQEYLALQMNEVEFSKPQQDMINGELALIENGQSEVFLYWEKEIQKQRQLEEKK
ncbi:phage replication initiation protein [Pilibacter termitis]|uniref:Phage replication initiation protein n=1 Tax=Pilibacter termitis TaxID=263852 RepID=A0A1T4NF24_9ENTE|nr:replication initiation factor domain-containing protein [Pilibacter termitis]SJZ77725.1 phage replication initiation protein [Pilibacter termitis]